MNNEHIDKSKHNTRKSLPSWVIYKTYSEVEPYLNTVQRVADKNRESLGFFAQSVYQELALRDRVWVVVEGHSKAYAGHLIFGGRYPLLRIVQAFVPKQYRHSGIGALLIRNLTEYGETHSFLSVHARVAADLAVNKFWERQGFMLIRQEPGGQASRRTINIRVKELQTPSLLSQLETPRYSLHIAGSDVGYTNRPLSNTPSYAIDLNVLFDLIRERQRAHEAELLIGAAFNNKVKICVTSEFSRELERRSTDVARDPLLALVKRLPVLPAVPRSSIEPLIHEIAPIVFPSKSYSQLNENDISDLRHLGECIHHKVFGFVTNERAFLRASDQVRQAYGIEITSPADLVLADDDRPEGSRTHASFADHRVSIALIQEAERSKAEKFLIARGVPESTMAAVLEPGASGSLRRRLLVCADDVVVAVASWDILTKYRKTAALYLAVDESHPTAIRVIDHILECVYADSESCIVNRLDLVLGPGQVYAKQTAMQRGFRGRLSEDASTLSSELCKISFNGIVNSSTWSEFARSFYELSGLTLPRVMPTFDELTHTGIVAKTVSGRQSAQFSLFEFETLVSPGLLVCQGREALIVPVQRRYAKDLFSAYSARYEIQPDLFPGKESLLHSEKSYFRNTMNSGWFVRGTPVIFYVSGKDGGQKAAIGMGRVTFSRNLSLEEVEVNLSRQGVLDRVELSRLGDKSHDNKIHAFTFDNFNLFPNEIPFRRLKAMGVVSDANLVTVQRLPAKHFRQLMEAAFGVD